MTRSLLDALFLSASLICALAVSVEARTFTDKQGNVLEGELIEVRGEDALIRRHSDLMTFTIPLSEFSAFDRRWILLEKENLTTETTPIEEESDEIETPTFTAEWPDKVEAEDFDIEIIKEDLDTDTFIYRSAHFEFHSNVKLARKVVREFASIFESTFAAVASLPVHLKPKPPKDGFYTTKLFETYDQYLEAGGIPNSGGVYMPRSRAILIPLTSLGVKKASTTYTIDKDNADNGTLIHEITHQVMHDWLREMPVWMTEGFAEFMEHIPYERETFDFGDFELDETLRSDEINLLSPEKMLNITYEQWIEGLDSYGRTGARINYFSAWLYTCFFLRNENALPHLYDYLRALESGQSHEKAVSLLYAGMSMEEIGAAVRAYLDDNGKAEVTFVQ